MDPNQKVWPCFKLVCSWRALLLDYRLETYLIDLRASCNSGLPGVSPALAIVSRSA